MKITKEEYRRRARKAVETRKKKSITIERSDRYSMREKEDQRKVLIKLILKYLPGFRKANPLRDTTRMPIIVYLESPKLYFTRAIEDASITTEVLCVIPNKEEFSKFHTTQDYNIYGQHRIQWEEHIHGQIWRPIHNVILYEKTLGELLETFKYEPGNYMRKGEKWNLMFLWADYCSSFSTNKEDINKMFSYRILGNKSVLALTFSSRDPKKPKTKYKKSHCIVAVTNYVTSVAEENGYSVKLLPQSGFYKASMYTAIFEVRHEQVDDNLKAINTMVRTHYDIIHRLNMDLSGAMGKLRDRCDS